MPISAPKPNSSPSTNRVDAFTTTAASTANEAIGGTDHGDDRWSGPTRTGDVIDRAAEGTTRTESGETYERRRSPADRGR
jgi:hypothetical protein